MFNETETNDDDDFFVPITSSSSNLANLFGNHITAGQASNSKLTYTPPKQPKTAIQSAKGKDQPKKLICMKTITLSRLVESNYTILGKFGIAIIADQVSADLIIYKTKQNILSSSKLSRNFKYKRINELVIHFRDDQGESWMAAFDSSKDIMDFVAELAEQGVEKQEDNSNGAMVEPEVLVKDDQVRADILGRISKMGLSILPTTESPIPLLSASALQKLPIDREQSESEPEEVIRTTKFRKVRGRHSESSIETMDLVPKPPHFAPPYHHHQLMDPLNIYFSENRTHNSEVRMNLTQLSTKIDSLLSELRPQPSLANSANERDLLERRIFDLEKRLDQQSRAPGDGEFERQIAELQKTNAQNVLKYDETITTLRKEVDTLKCHLATERTSRDTETKTWEEVRTSLEVDHRQHKEKVAELEALVENQKLKLQDFAGYFEEHQAADKLTREKAEHEQAIKLEHLADTQRKLHDAELQCSQLLQIRSKEEDMLTDVVKQAMNSMYENVLTDSTTISNVRDIKKILQKHLRSTTFDIIYQFIKCRKDLDEASKTTSPLSSVSVSPEFEVTV